MKHHNIKIIILGAAMFFSACGHKNVTNGNNTQTVTPIMMTQPSLRTPTEREVAAMPDSLFDGRPHIIVNSSFYDLNAKQVAMLRTFSNPSAPRIAAIIENLDSVMRTNHDTITTREALMQYYHYYDQLDGMTNCLTAEEQSQILNLE